MKKLLVFLLILLGVGLGGLLAVYSNARTTSIVLHEQVTFIVEPGEGLVAIADRLEQEGVISSAFWFRVYGKLNPELVTGIQAGEYVFDGTVQLEDVFVALQRGKFERKLTFIEGWRREQMAEYLAEKYDLAFGQEFLALTVNDEGMLFPDTYIVGTVTPQEVRNLLLGTFEQKLTAEHRQRMQEIGLTQAEVVNFAAIVEREVISYEDRKLVAGIMLKRWQNGWALDADATIQYALASSNCVVFDGCVWWPKELTFEDLAIDSPFNTRKVQGLPPHAIANPGMSAIEAVLYAEESPYWFYLSDKEGITRFAVTLEEHNANIAQYLAQ